MGNAIDYTLNEPITDKRTDRGSIPYESKSKHFRTGLGNKEKISYAASSMQGWRSTMEDSHLLVPSLTINLKRNKLNNKIVNLKNYSLFGVFDGHGGDFSAKYAERNMIRILCSQDAWGRYLELNEITRSQAPGVEILKEILTSTFLDLDFELHGIYGKRVEEFRNRRETFGQEASRLDRSGCTAVVVLLTPTHLICANAGDSRSVLCRDKKAYPLSFDHKPTSLIEQARIIKAGGTVKMKRVDGDLAVSRGLGDFRYKGNLEIPVHEQKVVSTPEFIVVPRDDEKDEFILIGCDGIWDVVNNKQSIKMVQEILNGGTSDIGFVCEEVLDLCLKRDSKDNMTICMVTLPACRLKQQTENDSINGDSTVLSRRGKRVEKQNDSVCLSMQAKGIAQSAVTGFAFPLQRSSSHSNVFSRRRSIRDGKALSKSAKIQQSLTVGTILGS